MAADTHSSAVTWQSKTERKSPTAAEDNSGAQAIVFKTQHILLAAFFLWLFLLHTIGIYFFTKGFLLTRLVLPQQSECSSPPIAVHDHGSCWHPKTFDKAVVIIIDALRYDFTVPFEVSQHYLNALTVLHETAVSSPQNAFLLPFIADPPTTTLQRLKGLTTGTLPTFIDAGSNFAGTAIEEDNLVKQLRDANKTLVHLGDDTWQALFPGYFDQNLTHSYDSFNVWDLHTVDNGVTEHLIPLLATPEKWDVIFGHYLGVDHAGHRYGPDHPAMAAKLKQMDGVLRNVIEALDDQTLLVVMGDHGMDAKGDHGGESDDEIEAALWMYSKKGVFGRSQPEFINPPPNAKTRPVQQIDLVPTLSLLLGMPVPFNNLGAPIEEAFIGKDGRQWKNMASVQALAASQIRKYQLEYAAARGLDESSTSGPSRLWATASKTWNQSSILNTRGSSFYKEASSAFSDYQKENLSVCKSLWARFDIPSMAIGMSILLASLVSLLIFFNYLPSDKAILAPVFLARSGVGAFAGASAGALAATVATDDMLLDWSLIGASVGSLLGYVSACIPLFTLVNGFLPATIWGWMSVVFTVSQSIGYASNSYTIWEDEIMLFFLCTFAVVATIASLRQATTVDRVLGVYHAALFMTLTRLASLSRLCREEQMPSCRSTYYASATSSTSAKWQLVIPYFSAIFLPLIIKSFYQGTLSWEASAPLWIGVAFRLGLLGSAIYWTLDAADNGEWLSLSASIMGTIKISVAQLVLATAFAAGAATFIWAPPCVKIQAAGAEANPKTKRPTVTVLGYANVHGTRYALLFVSWLLAVTFMQKPMGAGAISLMGWQIFSLMEIIDTNHLSTSSIGPIVLGLLGSFYFFKTGHQATLSSIQWDSAFVALRTIQYPWSPLLVILNTFGSQILAVIAVPLVVLWKQRPGKQGLLSDVARAMATHLAYYAVINLATTMWAAHLRRHLMLYRIFSPRFMTGAGVLLIVDLIGIFVAIGGFRWNMTSIAEVFGWS